MYVAEVNLDSLPSLRCVTSRGRLGYSTQPCELWFFAERAYEVICYKL